MMSNTDEVISDWFDEYSQDVYNFLVYYTGKVDVDDMVQEVFIKAYKGLNSYKKQANPKTWIFSIARHVAIDEIRKQKRKNWSNFIPFIDHPHDGKTPEELILQNEEQQELYQTIQQLPESYRDVLILRAIKDFSIAETAQILKWKETKVRTNYHRAIQAIRKQLTRGSKWFEEGQ
ncbi:RNA polymerase sigma factor [Bacillus niameyensis]|uniref:RNA polymerase sigma factor n=1 Tax=Bacillus niameyensis TaxID=1522308 RepID=UPI000B0D9460|nr:RNA polymerase sigma factor [Bacillus niameyensis]